MGIRQFKPVTKRTRFRSVSDFTEITSSTPEKSLTEPLKKSGGRDNHGHISMRRRGGGHKRKYRVIDFKRNRFGVPAVVKTIEYDPNRSARIALVQYEDGELRFRHRGHLPLFRNYDEHGSRLTEFETLLVDSEALESGDGALDPGYREAMKAGIEQFKRELVSRTGDQQAGELTAWL